MLNGPDPQESLLFQYFKGLYLMIAIHIYPIVRIATVLSGNIAKMYMF